MPTPKRSTTLPKPLSLNARTTRNIKRYISVHDDTNPLSTQTTYAVRCIFQLNGKTMPKAVKRYSTEKQKKQLIKQAVQDTYNFYLELWKTADALDRWHLDCRLLYGHVPSIGFFARAMFNRVDYVRIRTGERPAINVSIKEHTNGVRAAKVSRIITHTNIKTVWNELCTIYESESTEFSRNGVVPLPENYVEILKCVWERYNKSSGAMLNIATFINYLNE